MAHFNFGAGPTAGTTLPPDTVAPLGPTVFDPRPFTGGLATLPEVCRPNFPFFSLWMGIDPENDSSSLDMEGA